MPGSGRGPGLTAHQRRRAGRAPTAAHGQVPYAVLARRRPARPEPHGLQERKRRAANPVPAQVSAARTGTAAADRPVRRTSQGRAAGVPSRAPTPCRPARVRPCRTRLPARGAADAMVLAAARMRGARPKRWRGTRVRAAAAGGAAGPSSRPQPTVRPRWAVMSCWTAARRRAVVRRRAVMGHRAATRCPAGPRHLARTCRRARTGCRAAAYCAAGTCRRAATGPTAVQAQAGPPGRDAPRAGTRRPPGRRTLVPLRRCVASGSRTKHGLAGEGHAAGLRISMLTWTRPAPTTGLAAARGLPDPAPRPASAGSVPCWWPCWRSWSSRPARWPR